MIVISSTKLTMYLPCGFFILPNVARKESGYERYITIVRLAQEAQRMKAIPRSMGSKTVQTPSKDS